MADKNPIQKTLNYIDKHNIRGKITMAENGVIKTDDDLYEATVLMDTGITLDQVKKLHKAEKELITAVTYVGAELATEAFKADANLVETGFNYTAGPSVKVSGLYHRDNKDHTVVMVETVHRDAEFNRVMSAIGGMFADINS